MSMDGNIDFLKLLRSGDSKTFEVLHGLYYQKLLCFIINYIKNEEDSLDILQDVFIKIWKKRSQINSNLNGYIYATARNHCLDYLRKQKARPTRNDDFTQKEAWINYISLKDQTASLIIEKELKEQIDKAIRILPGKCRTVFIKSKIKGYRRNEIAEELNISVKTVENHLTKALKKMRSLLKDYKD